MDDILKTLGYSDFGQIQDHHSDIDIKDYNPGNGTGLPRFRVINGRLNLFISKTVISKFVKRGTLLEYCPRYIYNRTIFNAETTDETTDAQLKGLYFETHCLGKSAGDRNFNELPRVNKGTKKSTDNLRIDEQINMFKHLSVEYGLAFDKELRNVQKFIKGKYDNHTFHDIDIWLTSELDYIGPFIESGKFHQTAVIDLKLTKDLDSSFGDFQWSRPEYMDHTQATLICYMLKQHKIPFFYWIFDYKPSGRSNKIIHISDDVDNINPVIANNAKLRRNQLHEDIRKTVSEIVDGFRTGWQERPTQEQCKKCKLDCKSRISTISI